MALGWLPLQSESPWLQARETDGGRLAMLTRLAAATCPAGSAGRFAIVGTEQPWLNANTMAFLSARARPEAGWRCRYTGLGYAETDPARAWARLQDLAPAAIVMLDADRGGDADFLNRINRATRRRLEADPGFSAAPFAPGAPFGGITIFRRRP
jgi:hypothetical protein